MEIIRNSFTQDLGTGAFAGFVCGLACPLIITYAVTYEIEEIAVPLWKKVSSIIPFLVGKVS